MLILEWEQWSAEPQQCHQQSGGSDSSNVAVAEMAVMAAIAAMALMKKNSRSLLLNFLPWRKSMAGTQAQWLFSLHNLLPLSHWYQLIVLFFVTCWHKLIVIIFGNIAHGLFSFPKLTWFKSFVWLIVADLQLNLERWHKKVEMV